MTPIPPGWWLVGSGTLPVAQALSTSEAVVVPLVVVLAAALAVRSAWRAGSGRRGGHAGRHRRLPSGPRRARRRARSGKADARATRGVLRSARRRAAPSDGARRSSRLPAQPEPATARGRSRRTHPLAAGDCAREPGGTLRRRTGGALRPGHTRERPRAPARDSPGKVPHPDSGRRARAVRPADATSAARDRDARDDASHGAHAGALAPPAGRRCGDGGLRHVRDAARPWAGAVRVRHAGGRAHPATV